MATITTTVCDVCGDIERQVTSWAIVVAEGARVDLDLCQEHAAPLEQLLAVGTAGEEPQRPTPARKAEVSPERKRRRSGPQIQVHTLEDIEAMKER